MMEPSSLEPKTDELMLQLAGPILQLFFGASRRDSRACLLRASAILSSVILQRLLFQIDTLISTTLYRLSATVYAPCPPICAIASNHSLRQYVVVHLHLQRYPVSQPPAPRRSHHRHNWSWQVESRDRTREAPSAQGRGHQRRFDADLPGPRRHHQQSYGGGDPGRQASSYRCRRP